MRVDFEPLELTQNPGEISQFSENISAFGRGKEIILMAWQKIFRSETRYRGGKPLSAIGQRHAKNSEIDGSDLRVRQNLKGSSGVDVNAPAVDFDQKCEWFAQAPLGRSCRTPGRLSFRPGEWQATENAIVC
jgi:hypothetical protein